MSKTLAISFILQSPFINFEYVFEGIAVLWKYSIENVKWMQIAVNMQIFIHLKAH